MSKEWTVYERRAEIMRILESRRSEIMSNLAFYFGVSIRTICYDIDFLAALHPIETVRGEYGCVGTPERVWAAGQRTAAIKNRKRSRNSMFFVLFRLQFVFLKIQIIINTGDCRMNKQITRGDFLEYAQYNGELLRLEQEILEYRKNNSVSNINRVWYGTFKRRICGLAGWSAAVPALKSSQAYDMVYEYLYRLLSDKNFYLLVSKEIGG